MPELRPVEQSDASDALAFAERIFGDEARSFREAVRVAAERIGEARGLSPAELAQRVFELIAGIENSCRACSADVSIGYSWNGLCVVCAAPHLQDLNLEPR